MALLLIHWNVENFAESANWELTIPENWVAYIYWESSNAFSHEAVFFYSNLTFNKKQDLFRLPRKCKHIYFMHFYYIMNRWLHKTKKCICSFQAVFLYNFLSKLFLLEYDINRPSFINKLCLLPQLFSKMYFLFYAWVFDDVMKFENVDFWNLIFSRTKKFLKWN